MCLSGAVEKECRGQYRQLRHDALELLGMQHARVAEVFKFGADVVERAVDSCFFGHWEDLLNVNLGRQIARDWYASKVGFVKYLRLG